MAVRKDYLTFWGDDATLTNSSAQFNWRLDPSYFPSWRPGDVMYVKMSGVRFRGNVAADTAYQGVSIISNINAMNARSTQNGIEILAMTEGVPDLVGANNYVSTGSITCRMELRAERFYNFSILFMTDIGTYLTFQNANDNKTVMISLEVSYYCHDE